MLQVKDLEQVGLGEQHPGHGSSLGIMHSFSTKTRNVCIHIPYLHIISAFFLGAVLL